MIQIFFFGSSNIYGAGGENGGYADIVKQKLHTRMYGKHGDAEKYEIFNFGKSGATTDFVISLLPTILDSYGRNGEVIVILNVGGNNAKAEDTPNNYVSTLEEYTNEMTSLLDLLKTKCTQIIAVGGGCYDESKTNPKANPLTGGRSYHTNERKKAFEQRFKKLCQERNVPFVGIDESEEEWKEKYLYVDGLHANTNGHQLIAEKVLVEIEGILN